MALTKPRSISTKLTVMNVLVSGAALLLASLGFFVYDQITSRQSLVHTLSAQAQIVGSNSISALLFNDPQSATETLMALRNSPTITSAGILNADARPFARYSRRDSDQVSSIPPLSDKQTEGFWFRANDVILVRRILSEGRTVGYVYIVADLREIAQGLRRYLLISVAVLMVSLLFALLVAFQFRKSVAEPIIALADTARQVPRDRDNSVRVAAGREAAELSTLIDSFNEMLKEIQHRDTALQEAHDELEQRVADRTRELDYSNRELEAFSYSVSHDLRGPLDALQGFSYVLMKNYGDKLDASAKEAIQSIRAAARRMSELIDVLLNLSRVTTSAMRREEVDLSSFARSTMQELFFHDPERKVEFVVADHANVHGDARLLRIVMDNLLRNAWKYTSRHPIARIEFGRKVRDGREVYFVKDDGSGFDPRSSERLFQPFQRLHSVNEFSGDGIGLATVSRIVQRHGGEVWAEGEVEKGATFYFSLGTYRESAPEPTAGERPSTRERKTEQSTP